MSLLITPKKCMVKKCERVGKWKLTNQDNEVIGFICPLHKFGLPNSKSVEGKNE